MSEVKFTHLHVHSHYSLLDGLSKIPNLIDYTKELGMDAIAVTDHGVLYGAVEFFKKAKEKGIKPIIGAEIYLAFEKMEQSRPHIDDKKYHLVLLVKNETGYKNLVKLITKAHLEGFYYKPRVDEELLAKHADGLIALSACIQGKIPQLIIAGQKKEAEQQTLRYQEIFGKGNFYLELQNHPSIKEQTIVNQGLREIAQKYDIPLVATNDSHYLRKDDAKAQDILMLINTGADSNDSERLTMMGGDFSLKSQEEMIEEFKDVPEAIENTRKITELCQFEFSLGHTILPEFIPPDNKEPNEYLKELCEQNIAKRYGSSPAPEVKERLERELNIIKKTGFSTYLLIVQDFVRWAKENKIIVGPGRGSVAGSIVSYLLGITEIDPLKYDLLFERFLTEERISPPDIDLDFADTRRDEVIEYVREKYGKERVAQIITFGTMAARAAIRDVGRALGYPYSFCDRIAKMIPIFFTLDKTLESVAEFRQVYEEEEQAKTLIDYAKKLEGVARHASTHACGVVIAKEPLDNIVPLQHSSQNDLTIVAQYDMRCIEDLGLLKMDFLGLKNLTIIENALRLIEKNQEIKINLDSLALDDKPTFELFQKSQTTSVFQLESNGMKRWLRTLKPSKIEDIIAMVALYRPGPMELIPQYLKRKNGKEKIEYIHPKLEPILKDTYGIMIYQEQLMRIAKEMAGFSDSESDVLRKAIGKKIKALLEKTEEKLINGMINQGIDKKIAKKIWEWILPFAGYGFNKSHSACYAIIAYQTAYLKTHFPVEFMAAVLASERADVERIAFLIEECKSMKIEVLQPDINESEENFTVVDKNKIRFGLEAIKNVGKNIVEIIVNERKQNGSYVSIIDFISRTSCHDLNKKSLESLIKAGAFDGLEERKKLLNNLDKLLGWAKDHQKQKSNGQKSLFNGPKFNNKMDLGETAPATKKEKSDWEKELLGLYITSHPLEDFAEVIKQKAFPISKIVQEFFDAGKQVRIGGVISKIKKIITKNGQPMLFVTVEDQTDKVEVIAFTRTIERHAVCFQENKIVFISGQVNTKDGTPKIICEQIEEIIEEK